MIIKINHSKGEQIFLVNQIQDVNLYEDRVTIQLMSVEYSFSHNGNKDSAKKLFDCILEQLEEIKSKPYLMRVK